MDTRIRIEPADWPDRDALLTMQAHSFRTLGAPYYDEDVIESFIAQIGTMDDALLRDGTYYKAVAHGRIVGSGGWSLRTPGYALRSDEAGRDPGPGRARATVRSVFVHPAAAGRGIARTLMAVVEAEMGAAGFATASLAATLSGLPFYRRLGYRSGRPVAMDLREGRVLVALSMEKALSGVGRSAAA
jgi:GNAT superfamily N-acetyltransferase